METLISTELTLAQMRDKKGWTQSEVGQRLAEQMGKDTPYTHARISQIENEGTSDMGQMEALALIYEKTFDEIRRAVKNIRN